MATTASRPYKVTTPTGVRLVEAGNPTQAIRHCVASVYSAEACNGKEVAELMSKGTAYEQAKQEPAGEQLPLDPPADA